MYVSDRKTKMKNLGRLVGNNFLTNFFPLTRKFMIAKKLFTPVHIHLVWIENCFIGLEIKNPIR